MHADRNKIDILVNHTIFDRKMLIKREEANDIIQYLMPKLEHNGILLEQCKIDTTTEQSGHKRGDIWISLKKQSEGGFEDNIVCLIEAKHKKTAINDAEWRVAMEHGKKKAARQNLSYYVVTNCVSEFRFYNSYNDEEITLDGTVITKLVPMQVLRKIQSQVLPDGSSVLHKDQIIATPISENQFRSILKNLANIYRSAGLKKGDERIDPTISFVILKYISEKEQEQRTLHDVIRLWDSLRRIACGQETGDLKVMFGNMINMIWGTNSPYRENDYKDFTKLVGFPSKLQREDFKKIFMELDHNHFYGANFDLFGEIYEAFASQTKKKEFGEFYTRRHITGMVARLLLRNEISPRAMKICDPACGSGGFLTECFTFLRTSYKSSNKLTDDALKQLKKDIIWGYDNDEKSVARTKLNMFLVGDGHIHIYKIDSLLERNDNMLYVENSFNYVITNPPMGKYEGDAAITDFRFTNERRYELLFLEKIVQVTVEGGEMAVIINDGALEAPTRVNFRKKLLQYCDVNAIVSLTKFAFAPYTKEKTYVLFLQKKQESKQGVIQTKPIWHFVLDYDGFANSDKRYITEYHCDILELEEKFDGALKHASLFNVNKSKFDKERSNYERRVNERENREGLDGKKYGFITMDAVTDDNFYNLLSEFHLRPYTSQKITEKELDAKIKKINNQLQTLRINL